MRGDLAPQLGALFVRGRSDPIFFAEKILGVQLNTAQLRWFPLVTPGEDGEWPFHEVVHVAANQTGKSLGLAILILWACTYKIGTDHTDEKRWLEAPYYWFHVAPQQAQAYISLHDIELLVKGAHPAQVAPSQYPAELVAFEKIETGYDGFTLLTGAVAQFRTTDEKAKALQGRRAHGISFDEAAFENHLKAVINEALSMRLISTGGPLLLVSTPNGINDYYEIVESIRESAVPKPDVDRVWTNGDRALVWSHISDNVGFGISEEEATRKEESLDPATREQQLRGAFLQPEEAFFVPTGKILEAFRNFPEYVEPVARHRYVIFWDPSISSDPTAGFVVDVTSRPWRVVQEMYERKPSGIHSLIPRIREVHADRNSAGDPREGTLSRGLTGYDATSMGGAIIRQLLRGLSPQRPLEFGGASGFKLDVLTNLRAALLNGDLVIPQAMVGLKREIVNYRLKDDKIVNDRVMALAGAAWLASKGFTGQTRAAFSPHARITTSVYR